MILSALHFHSLQHSNPCLRGRRDVLTERHRRFSVYIVLQTPKLRVSRCEKSRVGENNVKRTDTVCQVLKAASSEPPGLASCSECWLGYAGLGREGLDRGEKGGVGVSEGAALLPSVSSS